MAGRNKLRSSVKYSSVSGYRTAVGTSELHESRNAALASARPLLEKERARLMSLVSHLDMILAAAEVTDSEFDSREVKP